MLRGSAVAALVGIGIPVLPPQPIVVTTPEQLSEAAAAVSAADSALLVLGSDLELPDGLVVPEGGRLSLDLAGHSLQVTASADGRAGIEVPGSSEFVLSDSGVDARGVASVSGAAGGAGIGGSAGGSTGLIHLSSVTVESTGGACGAGIGTGTGGTPGSIRLTEATVMAKGGDGGAGIGGGCDSDAGTLAVESGTLHAMAQHGAAAIGGGAEASHTPGSGAAVTFGADASVTLDSAAGTALGAGNGASGSGAFGSLEVTGTLTVHSGSITVPPTSTSDAILMRNTGRIELAADASLSVDGALHNAGTITPAERVSGAENISGNNAVVVAVDDAAEDAQRAPVRILAASLVEAGVTLPNLERADARFCGWTDVAGDTVTEETLLAVAALDEDAQISLSPCWSVRVDFHGEELTSAELRAGRAVGQPAFPVRDGHRFAGWVTAEGEMWDFRSPVWADLELFPAWQALIDENAAPVVEQTGTHARSLERGSTVSAAPALTAETESSGDAVGAGIDGDMIGMGMLVLLMIAGGAFSFGGRRSE